MVSRPIPARHMVILNVESRTSACLAAEIAGPGKARNPIVAGTFVFLSAGHKLLSVPALSKA
jgi:hypothetical protein